MAVKQVSLNEWLQKYDLHLDDGDSQFLKERMDDLGFDADCSDSDWTLFVGDGFVVEDTVQGTRVDHTGLYSVQSWQTHCEIRNTSGTGQGLSVEELFDAVSEAGENPILTKD